MNLLWRLLPKHTPIVLRRCPRCDVRTAFVSSDKFRINGQGRRLDVWLIYKCASCNQTWNSTILSRVSPESIGAELYQKFLDNDRDTAWRYAFDFEILKRNEVDFDRDVSIEVEGPPLDISSSAMSAQIKIEPHLALNARLDALLAQRLGLTRRKLLALFESGAVSIDPTGAIDRRIKRPLAVTVDLAALRENLRT